MDLISLTVTIFLSPLLKTTEAANGDNNDVGIGFEIDEKGIIRKEYNSRLLDMALSGSVSL